MNEGQAAQGAAFPSFFYGTAWKEERTEALTRAALDAGFRAIDTANQRRHYHEAGVGAALRGWWSSGAGKREELFIQTKYTYPGGQDHRLPYDLGADVATQVRQSMTSSLEHLGVSEVDSYLLHGPSSGRGFSESDRAAWRAMEVLLSEGKTRLIGASNLSLEQLEALCRFAEVKPSFIQNRCFARAGWDREVRAFAADHGVAYQGFSLLTANAVELSRPVVARLAERHDVTVPQLTFQLARRLGTIPLTGTSSPEHMREDLAALALALTAAEVESLVRATA